MQFKKYIDSWAIIWCYNQFLQQKFTVYPKFSFVKNIGLDNSGTHTSYVKKLNVNITKENNLILKNKITLDNDIVNEFRKLYSPTLFTYLGYYLRKKKQLKLLRFFKKIKPF
jgi:hypothetical protein